MSVTNIISISAFLLMSMACGDPAPAAPCDRIDPVLAASSFVLVVAPAGVLRTASPIHVLGFSGPAAFEFSAEFTLSEPEVGQLEVFERDESDGEGFSQRRVPSSHSFSFRAPSKRILSSRDYLHSAG